MNVTEPIIQVALLGTSNREFVPGALPDALAVLGKQVLEIAEDKESALYQISAAAFAYNRAGWKPQSAGETIRVEEAPEEDCPYFNDEQAALFERLSSSRYLLLYAYRKAIHAWRIIPPVLLPSLLRRAYDRNNPNREEELELLARLVGKRGQWLLQYMKLPDWKGISIESWETASHSERKQILARCRKEDPAKAIDLLRNGWKQESAAHRDELLSVLETNLSKSDEPFLQEVVNSDRSTTVKETARNLLFRMPDSEWVKRCCELLRGRLRYRPILGWSYDKLEYTPEMKQLGLEEVSSNKKEKDEEFLLRQLAQRVPLSFWSELLDCTPELAARKLVRHLPFRHFQLEEPVRNFSDSLWAYVTLKEDSSYFQQDALVALLTPEQRENLEFPKQMKSYLIPEAWYNADFTPWGPRFSEYVVSWLLQNKYIYLVDAVSERLGLYLAPQIRGKLEQAALENRDTSIHEFCVKTEEYMTLKTEIDKNL